MKGVPAAPRRIYGVDFSGAKDAGRSIRVCRAHPGNDGIRVESVDSLAELPGGAVDRTSALRALVEKVAGAPRSAWGLDFPFALPEAALPADGWQGQLDALARMGGPERMAEVCRDNAGGRELRRATDREARTPMSPYNLRLIRQTYHGMLDVLRPLAGRDGVAILPLDSLPPAGRGGPLAHNRRAPASRVPHIYVMEVCPASLLRDLGLDPTGYKGSGEGHASRRERLLRRAVDEGLIRPMARALRRRISGDPGGDALDAVLAAVAAWRGTREYDHDEIHADPRYAVEGFVYR